MTFNRASKKDCFSILFKLVSIKVLQALFTGLMLEGALETKAIENLYHDQNTVGPSALLPQKDDRAINRIKSHSETQQNETATDIINSQKQVPTSSIEKIGMMESIKDFSSLMVNTITMSTAVVDHKEMASLGSPSVICYVAHEYSLIVNSVDWAKWIVVTGGG